MTNTTFETTQTQADARKKVVLRTNGVALSKTISGDAAKRYESTRHCKIAIIDDEEFNIAVVKQYLNGAGYTKIVSSSDSTCALELIHREKPDLLILDIMMPEVGGLDILHFLSLNDLISQTPVLVLTAASDTDTRSICLELGVSDFLPKPVDATELLPRVRNSLENKIFRDRMREQTERLEQEVRQRTSELIASREEVIHCLARAAEFRDDDTGMHVVRVGRYAGLIAEQLGFSAEQVELLELAAQLHDVGKIGIPDEILRKPGKLDEEQYRIVQTHCSIAKKIISPLSQHEQTILRTHSRLGASLLNVSSSPLLLLAARIAQTHHERWDGTGYPLGLRGNDIPIEGRMTAVADVYDALSSRRPYKEPFPREKCFQILEDGRGTHFDPQVLDAFFARADDIVRIQMEYMDA